MADVLTVISGNGGMGKSFFACNLAYGLVSFGKKVLLVEGCFGTRADDVILGIKPDTLYTVADVIHGTCEVCDAITASPGTNLPDFIPAGHQALDINPADGFKKITSYAKDRYDYVIFDTPSSGSTAEAGALAASNMAFVLTDSSFLSLRNASLCTGRVQSEACRVYTVINNISSLDDGQIFVEDIVDETGAPLLGIIPYDEHVRPSLLNGDVIYRYNTYAGRALENICRRVLGQSVPDFESGAKNSFFQRNKLVLK